MEWMQEEGVGLFLVLFILGISIFLLVFQGQAYGSIVSCEKNPTIIGCQQRQFVQEKLAKETLQATGCAIESVMTGKEACSPEIRRKAEEKTWVSCSATSGVPLRTRLIAVEAWQEVELPFATAKLEDARAACAASGYASAAT